MPWELMLYLGGLDLTVADDLCHKAADEGLALVSWPAQVLDLVTMPHHGPLHD